MKKLTDSQKLATCLLVKFSREYHGLKRKATKTRAELRKLETLASIRASLMR